MNGLQLTQATILTNPDLTSLAKQAVNTTVRPVGVDLTPPDTTPPTIQLSLAQDTGTVGDGITSISTITGRILDQSSLVEVTASFDGQRFTSILNWIGVDGTVTLDRTRLETIAGQLFADRAYQLTVRGRDQFGNLTTTATIWTIDTQAPTELSVDLADASDTGRSPADNVTQIKSFSLSGTAEAGSRVQLFLAGKPVGQAIVSMGTWQVPVGSLVDGTYEVKVVATDIAGNTSQVRLNSDLVIDTQVPTAPASLRRLANSFDAAPNAVTIAGIAEANAIVTLYQGTQSLGESIAASDGSWTITTLQLGSGIHTLTATATDAAGNTSSRSSSIVIDPLPAPAPRGLRLAPESDSGRSNADGITNSNSLFVVGIAEAGATVKLFNDDRTLLGQSQADATGNWRIGITQSLTDNTYNLTATATNLIGKSAGSDGFKLTIDRTAPTVTLTTPLGGSTPITPRTRLSGTINGTGSAGATLNYRLGTGSTTTIQTPANGLFNSLLMLTQEVSGSQPLVLTATDVAGNQSTALNYAVAVNPTDNTPDIPVLVADLAQDTGVSKSDRFTNDAAISGVVSARNRMVGLQAALVVPSVLVAGGVADPVSSAPFQDIAATIDEAGNFSLSQEQLVALYGSDLADGTYALKLRAKDELGNFSETMRVTFTLDLTAPRQDITSLIDGITWMDDEVLAGSVSDGTGTGVHQVAYRLWQSGSSGESSGDQAVTISQTGTFSQALSEIQNLAAGVYDLSVTSSDLAGNRDTQAYRFLKPEDSLLTDPEINLSAGNGFGNQDGSSSPPSPGQPGSPGGPGGEWGYVGPRAGGGFGWGTYGSTPANANPVWTPSDFPGFPGGGGGGLELEYIGLGYDLEYTETVETILDYGAGAMSNHPLTVHKKAALKNRQDVLKAIADRLHMLSGQDGNFLNDTGFFARMQGVMQNIFASAYDPTGDTEGRKLNGLIDREAARVGYGLAQDLVVDSTAVRLQVFQATLLAVFNEVLYGRATSFTPETQQTVLKAALELGQTYAKLAPSQDTGAIATSDRDFGFLDILWRAQQPDASGRLPDGGTIALQLKNGVEALGRSLNGVSDPVATLKFLNNLLNAAANSVSLNEVRIASNAGGFDPRGDIRSSHFIRELIQFGFEVAKVNPTAVVEDLGETSGWIEILLAGGEARNASKSLNQFFRGLFGTLHKIDALKFTYKLIEAAQNVESLEWQQQSQSAEFLDDIAELGSSYFAAKIAGVVPDLQPESIEIFLSDLWSALKENENVFLESFQDFRPLTNVLRLEVAPFASREVLIAASDTQLLSVGFGDLSVKIAKRALKWLSMRNKSVSKHIFTGHIARRIADNTYFTVKGSGPKKLIQQTLEKPDQVLKEGGSWVFEKRFKRVIGSEGTKVVRVIVIQGTGKIVSAYPTANFRAITGVTVGVVLAAANRTDAAITDYRQRSQRNREQGWLDKLVDFIFDVETVTEDQGFLEEKKIIDAQIDQLFGQVQRTKSRPLSKQEKDDIREIFFLNLKAISEDQ
ncbi:MAG: hypothetical protein HC780_26035 [Leptolyngbyaceae cyanobacterium CSU_1_3]|nr:hypothetical protein [Leptolyngbyaceae cyanobacterium CSU_1_3]